MPSVKVFDLPTRFFHWFFVSCFVSAFLIAKTVDDESVWYVAHMFIGLTMVFGLILRILWGFIGTKYALFSHFQWNPKMLLSYFKNFFEKKSMSQAGHNPATSWAAVGMMLCGISLGITGYLMTSGQNKEDYEDIHEVIAYVFLSLAVSHVLGVVTHEVRFRDWLWNSMYSGKKNLDNHLEEPIVKRRAGAAIAFVCLIVAFSVYLIKNYDFTKGTLKVLGSSLQLLKESGDEP